MRYCLSSLVAAALALTPAGLVGVTGMLLPAGITASSLLISQPVFAASAEDVAKIAQAITVRIEGATQGSGVLVKKEGSRYTVLTAWHVVEGQRPGEEIAIYTPDGKQQQMEQKSIKRLEDLDMAVLTFSSTLSLSVAKTGDMKTISMGSPVYVSGYPLSTSDVPNRLMRFLDGRVIASANVRIPNGYQLLYSNATLPGMSGGGVFNDNGELIGIHGKAERFPGDASTTEKSLASGTNQGIPISYYQSFENGRVGLTLDKGQPLKADDYLAQAQSKLDNTGQEADVIRLANLALGTTTSGDAYYYRGYANAKLKRYSEAISDFTNSIAINPKYFMAWAQRAEAQLSIKEYTSALHDYNQAILIDPGIAMAWSNRGQIKVAVGENAGALSDMAKAISLEPQNYELWQTRGFTKFILADHNGAIADFTRAIQLNGKDDDSYSGRAASRKKVGDLLGALADYNKALAINDKNSSARGSLGFLKYSLGDRKDGCSDIKTAIVQGESMYEATYLKICR